MFSRLIFLFLCNCYCFCSGEDTKTTLSLPKYPCDNLILFGVDNTENVTTSAFQKQLNFLANYTFEKWTHFDDLAFLSYSSREYTQFGSFNSKDEVEEYIQGIKHVESENTACAIFGFLCDKVKNTRIILFLNRLYLSDISDVCIDYLKQMVSNDNAIAFVPLSDQFDRPVLNHYFKQAKIIEWNVTDSETPNDWEEQFDDFYGCRNQTTTTIRPTEKPSVQYPPCNTVVTIAFDKSNGFSKQAYQEMQNFLISHVFKNWTRFDNLDPYSFDNHIYSNIVPFANTDDLMEFIQSEEQSENEPDLCNFLHYFINMKIQNIVIFLSAFKITEWSTSCQGYTDNHVNVPITFVLLNDKVNTDVLKKQIPQVQFIKLNLSDIPINWEWQFLTAYGCNQDDANDQIAYPCKNKFIFGYEVSSKVDKNVLKNFLINEVFKSSWNVFNNLALISYSNDTVIQDFGTMNNLSSIHSFIDKTFKQQNANTTSLCNVFNRLTTMYLNDVNVVLFVNEFHSKIADECSIWIRELRIHVNSIKFVNLTKNVNIQYLISHIPQSSFASWDLTNDKAPNNWGKTSYGCQNFIVNVTKYPCISYRNEIVYDRSHFLSPFAYERLTNFLLMRVFIKQASNGFDIYNYPDDEQAILQTNILLKQFIRQSLRSYKNPIVCSTLKYITEYSVSGNLLFFVSKFDETVFTTDSQCTDSARNINKYFTITFFKLGQKVNDTLLHKIFPNSTIVNWDIEKEDIPLNWAQVLWTAFGCYGNSPIIFPQSTSTVLPTTKALTTTRKSSTALISTEHVQTTQRKTTSLITTTKTHITTTKAPDSKGMSREVVILLSIFVPLLIIIIIAVIAYFCWDRSKQRQQLVNVLASKEGRRNDNKYETDEPDPWKIQPEFLQINFIDKLGSGAFGDVYLGRINGDAPIKNIYSDSPHCQRFHDCSVAVKALPAMQVGEYARNEFQKEIDFMKSLKFHPNLVCFLGYVSDPTNPLMLLEYCSNGDLLHFIKTNKQKFVESFENSGQEDCKTLISFAWQISSGLEYLSSLDLIHRDVAARNILLDKNNVCKVSDFGLCRNSTNQFYQSSGGKLPIKWMAIESLKENVFSTKTDVWSYGVLLWELFTLGEIPYAHVDNVLKYLGDGKRLEQPDYCSENVYNIMSDCWLIDPEDRPMFTIISQLLTKMLETSTLHYNYVDTLALIEEANQIDEINV